MTNIDSCYKETVSIQHNRWPKYTSTPKINKYIKWLQIAVLVALHSNFQSQHLSNHALWYPLEEVHLEQNPTWIGANSSSIAFQS